MTLPVSNYKEEETTKNRDPALTTARLIIANYQLASRHKHDNEFEMMRIFKEGF